MDGFERAEKTGGSAGGVLIVDDSQAIRERLSSLITRVQGVRCILEAATRQEALDVAGAHHPSVILVDVHIGAGDAASLLCELRQRCRMACVVALVRYNSPSITEEYRRLGADACFDKGLELTQLLDLVAQWVDGALPQAKPKEERMP